MGLKRLCGDLEDFKKIFKWEYPWGPDFNKKK